MTDKPSKFDLNTLLSNIKSLIQPGGDTPNPDPSDRLGNTLAELSVLAQALQHSHEEQGKKLAEMSRLFNEVYQQLEALRHKDEEGPSL